MDAREIEERRAMLHREFGKSCGRVDASSPVHMCRGCLAKATIKAAREIRFKGVPK